MELVVLGCHAGMPAPGQPSSGYLVATDAGGVLLDCGPGVAAAARPWVERDALDGIVLSHLHVDHCLDVLLLGKARLAAELWAGAPPVEPIPLWVPPGGTATLRALNALFPLRDGAARSPSALDRVFDVAFTTREYEPGRTVELPGCRITMVPVVHAIPAHGIRVDAGGDTLAYSGDTGMTPVLVELARDADVFLCEATLNSPDRSGHGHLSAHEAGTVAAAARVGALVLTHVARDDPAWIDGLVADAVAKFDGPVSVARPGARVPVGRDPHPDVEVASLQRLVTRQADRAEPITPGKDRP